jgi:hypothetical protein
VNALLLRWGEYPRAIRGERFITNSLETISKQVFNGQNPVGAEVLESEPEPPLSALSQLRADGGGSDVINCYYLR